MKRLGMLLVLVSVSMFALGCAEKKEGDTGKDTNAPVEKVEGEGDKTPAEGDVAPNEGEPAPKTPAE